MKIGQQGDAHCAMKIYSHFGNQVDARRGGRPLLALDQGGTATNPTHQGFTFCHHMSLCGPPLCAYYAVQDIFELSMILATRSQCNLASLDVFEDDIPEVTNIRQITYRKDAADNIIFFTFTGS